ncbi:MAG TPA: 7-cyano-7-deazaguanine synthase [Phycisphaerae bacterium]|nr:7-cyano-7-deazaguanine synthase [Phycisphaerae bacterium]
MPKEKAIVLNSGGLHSAVLTSMVADEHELAMLHVRVGHRAEDQETGLFEKQADHFEAAERLVVEMPHFEQIGGIIRVGRERIAEDALTLRESESNAIIPGLIGALVQAAFTWAHTNGATKIFLGVCENPGPPGPQSGALFPEYSRDFALLCRHLYAVGAPDRAITLETPLIEMNRADIIRLGRRLQTPFELTWSCLASGETPCGHCLGCATRNRGFLDAAVPDPILLQPVAAGA